MSDVHTVVRGSKNEATVVFDNPGVPPLLQGAGQPVAQVKDASGKPVSTSGQVTGTSVIFNSPG